MHKRVITIKILYVMFLPLQTNYLVRALNFIKLLMNPYSETIRKISYLILEFPAEKVID